MEVTCSMPVVSELYIYPVKSLGGIKISSTELTDRGFKYDRRWMLVDMDNRFLTQRELPLMALLQTEITDAGLKVNRKNNPSDYILIPFTCSSADRITVNVWDDFCDAIPLSDEFNKWFSEAIRLSCRLVYMPDDSLRKVDRRYAVRQDNVTSFSDAYPVLMISEESLADLNNRMDDALPINRFRPNIVIKGCTPFEEDTMRHFKINGIDFYGVKLCARCVLTTINQDTAESKKEPLKTMYTYRARNNNVYFGQNVLYHGKGAIRIGDEITVIEKSLQPVFDVKNAVEE
jgi:uncharacterized protein